MKHVKLLTLALTVAAAPVTFAATPMTGMDMKPAGQAQQAPKPVAAEVRKVYPDTGEVTLKHGAIDNLGMGAMTMTFAVKGQVLLADNHDTASVAAYPRFRAPEDSGT